MKIIQEFVELISLESMPNYLCKHSFVVIVLVNMSRQIGHVNSLWRLRAETAISVSSVMASCGVLWSSYNDKSQDRSTGSFAVIFAILDTRLHFFDSLFLFLQWTQSLPSSGKTDKLYQKTPQTTYWSLAGLAGQVVKSWTWLEFLRFSDEKRILFSKWIL